MNLRYSQALIWKGSNEAFSAQPIGGTTANKNVYLKISPNYVAMLRRQALTKMMNHNDSYK